MKRPGVLGLLATAAAALFPAMGACSGKLVPSGGLMLVIRTDGTLSPDRLHVQVASTDRTTTYRNADYAIPAEVTLPTTLAIASNGNATASVAIDVSVWAAAQPLDLRQNQVQQIPTDRVAELDIVLSAKCSAKVTAVGGKAQSLCPDGQTCDPATGGCVNDTVNGGSLPTWRGDGGAESATDAVADFGAIDVPGDAFDAAPDAVADAAPDVASDGNCGNVQSDPHNCGYCGHDCQGGACASGACQPVTLASGPFGSSEGIAVDATNVYWASCNVPCSVCQGTIAKAPINGGNTFVLSAPESGIPRAIAVNATTVFWGDSAVKTVPIDGGSGATLAPGQSVNGIGIAVDATTVYWTSGNGVISMPIGGGSVTTIASGQSSTWAIAVDATTVYWTNYIHV